MRNTESSHRKGQKRNNQHFFHTSSFMRTNRLTSQVMPWEEQRAKVMELLNETYHENINLGPNFNPLFQEWWEIQTHITKIDKESIKEA